MSKYTTEVRFICETAAGYDESKGFDDVESILTAAAPVVFNFEFPIFDEAYRLPLERKILRHYYTREIGEETVGLWKLRLADKLNVIMPYYNKLYNSELITFNPMYDVDVYREHEGSSDTSNNVERNENENVDRNYTRNESDVSGKEYERKDNRAIEENRNDTESTSNERNNSEVGNMTRNSSSSSEQSRGDNDKTTTNGRKSNDQWNLYSDTPQGGIQGIVRASDGESNVYDQSGNVIGTADVADNAYLTNARHIIDNENVTNNVVDRVNNSKTSGVSVGDDKQNTNVIGNEKNSGVRVGDSKVGRNENGGENGNSSEVRDADIAGNEGVVGRRDVSENGNIVNFNEYAQHVYGKQGSGSFSKLLAEFRETFLNIDNMILDELRPLFMNIW